jgi:hypothetical protein
MQLECARTTEDSGSTVDKRQPTDTDSTRNAGCTAASTIISKIVVALPIVASPHAAFPRAPRRTLYFRSTSATRLGRPSDGRWDPNDTPSSDTIRPRVRPSRWRRDRRTPWDIRRATAIPTRPTARGSSPVIVTWIGYTSRAPSPRCLTARRPLASIALWRVSSRTRGDE